MVLLFSSILAGESKEYLTIKRAAQLAADKKKMLVVEFWAPSCNPCMGLKRDIFDNSFYAEFINKQFHLIKVSPADSVYKPLWKYYNLEYQSTVIYVDAHGNEMDRTVGYNGDRDGYIAVMKEIARRKNLYKDVVRQYRRDTLNVSNGYAMARKLATRYEFHDALKLFQRVLHSDPKNNLGRQAECIFRIAEIDLTLTGSFTKMRDFVTTFPKNPFAPKAYVYLINDLMNKQDKTGCLSFCESGLSKYPDSWEILNKYAWAICTFKIKEDYPKALSMVQKSISLNPARPGTYSTEAWIHFEMGDKAKAIQLQKMAVKIFPDAGFVKDLATFENN